MAGKKINLTDQLKKYFGFDTFKGNQEAIIQNLLAGNDTFVLMPTGGGKSLCYQLPSLMMEGTGIVISPLIALMKNQVDAMRNFSEEDGIAHFINSSLNKGAIDQVKSDILSGKTKLLYVAPESLTKEENVEFLKTVTGQCDCCAGSFSGTIYARSQRRICKSVPLSAEAGQGSSAGFHSVIDGRFFFLHGKRYRPCAEILGEAGTPLALLHHWGKRSDRNRLSAACPEGRKRNPSNTGILDFRPDCGCTGCFCCIR